MEVLGAITAIIGLIDAIDRAYTAIEKIKGLPKAFETVKRHLPAVQKGLQEIQAKREENRSQAVEADKELQGILKNCEANVRVLQAIFDELQAKCNKFGESEWVWKDRCKDLYKSALQGSKAKRVESLMAEIWGDVKHLALTEIIGLRSYVSYVVDDKIQELEKVEPSLEDRELEGTGGLHATQNIASGGTGTQTNVEGDHNIVNSGNLTGEFAGGHFENFHYGDHYYSNEQPSDETVRRSFLYKLRGMDYKARLRTVQRPLQGTCQWFLQHPSLKAWLQNKTGLLLVSADAGCGKSVLAKYLIEQILHKNDPEQTVCYFLFKDDEPQARSFTNASKALLHQLLERKGALIDKTIKPHEPNEKERTILEGCMGELTRVTPEVDKISDFRQVWSVFERVSKNPDVGPVTCVLDALDEGDPSQLRDFLEDLKYYLHNRQPPAARFIVTTRGYPQILNEFKGFAKQKIHLDGDSDEEKKQIQKEINIVMDHRLNGLKTEIPGISEATLEIIRSGLTERGAEQKTYLWMHLMFELFEKKRSSNRARWRDIFENPPKTIASAYEKLLDGVDEESRGEVRTLLALIIAAEHPLTITELSAAFSARTNTKIYGNFDMSDVPEEDEFKDWIRWQCGSFVTIHGSKAYLIHQTAREFLLADLVPGLVPGHGHWRHSIAEYEAHQYMAESCISWLSHDYFQTAEFFFEVQTYISARSNERRQFYDHTFQSLRGSNESDLHALGQEGGYWGSSRKMYQFSRPFFSYAAKYWVGHFKNCQRRLSSTEVEDIEPEFVAKYEGLFAAGDLEDRVRFCRSRETETRHVLERSDVRLLETHDLRFPETHGLRFPGTHELRFSETHDLRLPETHNLQLPGTKIRIPDKDDLYSMNPSSVDSVDLRDTEGFSGIENSAFLGWNEELNRISVHTAHSDAMRRSMDELEKRHEADHSASNKARSEARSRSMNVLNKIEQFLTAKLESQTPLEMPWPESVVQEKTQAWQCLMIHEDQSYEDPEKAYKAKQISRRVPHYWNLARDGCLYGHKRLLVHALNLLFGALDEADELTNLISEHDAFSLYSLVHVAAQRGSNLCLEYLYRKGFDVHIRNTEGQTPLHKAAGNGHEKTVAILLGFGASNTVRDNHQRTPITYAMSKWNRKELVENYLASIQKDRGRMRSLLYFAAIAEAPNKNSASKAIEIIKKQESSRRLELSFISESPIVPLIAIKANFEFRYGNNNLTALHVSVKKANRILNTLSLLRANVDIEALDDFGNTAFHVATWYGNVDGLRALLEFGADINCCGNGGDTALHIACRNGNAAVARFLLLKDADPEIWNTENQSVFDLNEQLGLLNMKDLIRERNGANTKKNFREKLMREYGSEKIADLFVAMVEDGKTRLPWVE